MASYAEYLKSNGATDADITILDTPVARKAYERMEASVVENARLLGIAEQDRVNFQKWYNDDALPAYTAMQDKVVKSEADLGRARAAVLAARDQGLADVAKAAGFDVDTPVVPPNTPPAFDASKYVSTDSLRSLMEEVGGSLAGLQDMVIEHSALFPGTRLNVSELRREAVAAKKNIQQFWNEKYNVPAARQAAADREKATYETKLRDEGAAAERAKYADLANPNLRPLVSSNSPFTTRPDHDRTKQPWETGDRTGDRVANATRKLIEQQATKTN